MNLEHSFTVPVGIDDAWKILLDIERIGPCMPGATIDSVDGDDFTGAVKVKLGPIGLTYKGKASFVEKDDTAHRAVIDARGRDARGNGTAAAKVTAVLTEQGEATVVNVTTDLDITGKPAQFGRGVMVDVGNKLIGQFADNLASTISGDGDDDDDDGVGDGDAGTSVAAAPTADEQPSSVTQTSEPAAPKPQAAKPGPRPSTTEPINLIESAGPAVAKRLAPVAAVVALLVVLVVRRRSR